LFNFLRRILWIFLYSIPARRKIARRSSRAGLACVDWLNPRHLTLVMGDQAFPLRRAPGASYADYDEVFDDAARLTTS